MARDLDATMPPPTAPSRRTALRRRAGRAFTLVELMIVVAMIGVLASLALVGFRRYITSAQTTEATGFLATIRGRQEAGMRAESTYFAVSGNALGAATLLPRALADLDDRKVGWPDPAPGLWPEVGRPDGPVRFSYAVVADVAGTTPPGAFLEAGDPLWDNAYVGGGDSPEPWWVAAAVADRNENDIRCVIEAGSFSNEVYVYNELE